MPESGDLWPIPTDPHVVELQPEDEGPKEVEEYNATAFEIAQIGDVQMISDEYPIPDGWRILDGKPLISGEWPEYVESLRWPHPTFTLPEAKSPDGFRFIVKLGRHAPGQPRRSPEPPMGFPVARRV